MFTNQMNKFVIIMKEIGFTQEDTTVMLMFLNEEGLLDEMINFLEQKKRTMTEVIQKEKELMIKLK